MMTVVVSNHLECLFLKIKVNWHSSSSSWNVDEDAAPFPARLPSQDCVEWPEFKVVVLTAHWAAGWSCRDHPDGSEILVSRLFPRSWVLHKEKRCYLKPTTVPAQGWCLINRC